MLQVSWQEGEKGLPLCGKPWVWELQTGDWAAALGAHSGPLLMGCTSLGRDHWPEFAFVFIHDLFEPALEHCGSSKTWHFYMIVAEQWPSVIEMCLALQHFLWSVDIYLWGEKPQTHKNCVHFWQVGLLFIGKITKEEAFLSSCLPSSLPPSLRCIADANRCIRGNLWNDWTAALADNAESHFALCLLQGRNHLGVDFCLPSSQEPISGALMDQFPDVTTI